uniref:Transposase n=1 Tax=Steinernema glaseri TaxID=37863 RepID=A0A1I7Z173_9BILA
MDGGGLWPAKDATGRCAEGDLADRNASATRQLIRRADEIFAWPGGQGRISGLLSHSAKRGPMGRCNGKVVRELRKHKVHPRDKTKVEIPMKFEAFRGFAQDCQIRCLSWSVSTEQI